MSTSESEVGTVTPPKRSVIRRYFPLILLGVAAVAVGSLYAFPMDQVYRNLATALVVVVYLVLTTLWLLGFSGYPWLVRLGIPACVAGTAYGAIDFERTHMSGDMVPLVVFRWEASDDDIREAHRKEQGKADDVPLTDADAHLPTDFPAYRGRDRDGVVVGPPLARDWETQPPREIWKQPGGGGFAAFVISGNVAVTIEQIRAAEAVVCYDIASGKERWRYDYAARFSDFQGGPGPRATPTIFAGMVYSVGAQGKLTCIDLATGKLAWSADILTDNGNIQWGMSGSPLVYDDVVVVNPGVQQESAKGGALAAYDRLTGKLKWKSGNTKAGYSSPMLATLAGTRQILLFDGKQIAGYDAKTGTELWNFPWPEKVNDINVAQPLVLPGDRLLVSTGYDVGSALLHIQNDKGKWSVKPIWGDPERNTKLRSKFATPVYYKGHIYGLDEGILTCLDAATGDMKWRGSRYGHGQLLLADDLLIILSDAGKLALVEAKPDKFQELGRISALKGRTWNNPAMSDGKLYIRNERQMACYDLRK